MLNNKKVRIGCASAFWGDTNTAAKQLVQDDNIDYLVFDFLSEVTMSILAGAKMKNNDMGYAPDFVRQLSPLLNQIKKKKIKIISNAGGINPDSCRLALLKEADKKGIKINIAVVYGDNLIDKVETLKKSGIKEMESQKLLPEKIMSVNAYLGAPGIVKALEEGAEIVITGRCVDSAMVLGPLIHEFKWKPNDYDLLASGSLAGHIIECGAQCTGGNFTDWKDIQGFENMGFPIVEVLNNGHFTVSKPSGTGGLISFGTVAEQFLYEIGDPSKYILPDVVCDFTEVTINDLGGNVVFLKGAKGYPPTDTYKVSATYMDGYQSIGTLVIGGVNAKKKGELIANAIIEKTLRILAENSLKPFIESRFDQIGTNWIYGSEKVDSQSKEIVLRIMVRHSKKEALILFSRELSQAATGMPPGVINYLGGRPKVSPSIYLFSFLIQKDEVEVEIELNNNTSKVQIDKTKYVQNTKQSLKDIPIIEDFRFDSTVPLMKLAFARSGDKGDHANIGVISRRADYLPFIKNALTKEAISSFFKHVLKGSVESWDVPGISGINFLLKNSLGGGGMASLNLDPQGKAYAQQLLEFEIPVPYSLKKKIDKN